MGATSAHNLDGRVRHVESEVGTLKTQVRDLDLKIDDNFGRIFGKLDDMGRAQAAMQAQRPASWDKILAFVVHAAVLIGMGTGAILFVARGLTLELTGQAREDLAVMKYKVDKLETGAAWAPQVMKP